MLRGTTTFVCDNCGNKFKALNIEWQTTVLSQPAKCPKCGSYHTMPDYGWLMKTITKSEYRKIWAHMDEVHKKMPQRLT